MSVLPRLSNKGQMPAVLAPLVVRSRFSVLARNLCEEVLFFLLLLLPTLANQSINHLLLVHKETHISSLSDKYQQGTQVA